MVIHEALERTIRDEQDEQVDSARPVKHYIRGLRSKIGDKAKTPIWIASVHRLGYQFVGPRPDFSDVREPVTSLAGYGQSREEKYE